MALSASRRIHVLLLGQYTSLGLLGGFSLQLLPAYLRREGVGLDSIGLVALVFLPHALKLLWAPQVDRWCREQRRTCLLLCYGSLLACIFALASIDPVQQLPLALGLLGLAALCAASGDIASDGLAVAALPEQAYPTLNRLQIGGSYLGYLLAGLLAAPLLDRHGWHAGTLVLGALLALCLLPLLSLPLPRVDTGSALARPSLRHAWRSVMRRRAGLVLLAQCGPRLMLGMASAYWIDRGLSLTQAGALEAWCIGMGLLGSLAAPALLQRFGNRHSWCAGLLVLLGVSLWLLAGERWEQIGAAQLVVAFSLANLATGLIFVALYSRMMQWADPGQPGTDVTLLQCTDAWIGLLAGLGGAWLAHWVGFDGRFLITAALLLAGLIGIHRLLDEQPRPTTHSTQETLGS
ncbi:MFS transporter (putative signal transducer) [Pseudomonas sp. BIGb0408]|uniref:MFS transporter (Putative signal transducer) n=1 Tax=Phytopseudomonas flavescens TaxID=29435 RepID=A0A7Y9XR81_9GAMM|nr:MULTISPECIES: MFS transporter [Pseudomonas]MCW2290733.1 MFS transporter (putative signal transducer) [Pseudomonas sp. BIGb0408]NYH74694.1 MFS transporter (putative signal transducer) [Pseudomonas flavescens]